MGWTPPSEKKGKQWITNQWEYAQLVHVSLV
jgi:hypothetical protein